ncbi:MAG: hypothetical protein HQ477_12530 [Chloroflexi bacterium]|nr:hypothetical protein [Chloroflexota bacterium]
MRIFTKIFIQPNRALPWAIVLLLLLEVALYTPAFWNLPAVQESRTGERVFDAANQRSSEPAVIAIGSSRFQKSIVPLVIEKELRLNKGSVANLAFDAATPQDYLHLYKSQRDYFSSADLLLIEVGEFHYNWSAIADEAAGNIRFRRLASLTDRMSTPNVNDKIDYTLGSFIRIWDKRFVIRDILSSTIRDGIRLTVRPIEVDANGKVGLIGSDLIRVFETQEINQLRAFGFRNFEISEYQINAMIQLVNLAKSDDLNVILMSPPINEGFRKLVAENYASYDREWRDRIKAEFGQEIIEVEIVDSRCSDWRECFYDYGHTNAVGAESYSLALAGYLSTQIN